MKYFLILGFAFLCVSPQVQAQDFYFGIKGGPSIATQKWNGFSGRDPLFRYHGDIFIESTTDENQFGFYAQLGYHIKGSSLRFRRYYNPILMQEIPARKNTMEFHNASLALGAKKKFAFGAMNTAYYGFGLRLDYNLKTKLGGYFQTYEGLENNFTYGVIVQAGLEVPFGDFVEGMLEVSISPDLSKQIYIPPQDTGFTDPLTGGRIILQEQNITNILFEVSVGLRFLRKVVYID